jgi:site-specific recombinase XerD
VIEQPVEHKRGIADADVDHLGVERRVLIGDMRIEKTSRFPSFKHGKLTRLFLAQQNVDKMIRRHALAAGIETKLSCHSFRPDITTFLQNGGKLEVAQQMAGHESARTTGLYDRRKRHRSA